MFHTPITTCDAKPVDLVEAEIIIGLSQCKSVGQIAAGIVALLEAQKTAARTSH